MGLFTRRVPDIYTADTLARVAELDAVLYAQAQRPEPLRNQHLIDACLDERFHLAPCVPTMLPVRS